MDTYRSPWLTAEHDLYRDNVRRFVETEFVPLRQQWIDQGHSEPEAWRRAGDAGLLLPDVPTEYGGGGADFGFDAIVYEELGRALVSGFGCAIQSIVAHYFLAYATEEQKRKYLPKMATGELICSIAMTEPGTGSDLQSVRTKAVRDGDHYLVNGSKTFITNGYNANLIVLVCKTNPAEKAKGVSLLLVETEGLEGFRRGKPLKKIGMKGQDTSELFFDDCRVPVGNILGGVEGQGFYQLMNQLGRERLMIGLQSVASLEAAVHHTLEYVRQREAFGQKLFDFQNTRFTLVECATEARIARTFVDDCIQRLIDGKLDSATASMAKYWCSERAQENIHRLLQMHGGYGYIMDYPIAHLFADHRVAMIYGGSNEIMKELIARSL